MTALKLKAPTLDECIADSEKDVMFFAQIATAEKQLEIAMANKKFLERLRAIENAKGMPEEPRIYWHPTIGSHGVIISESYIRTTDYDALHLHAQHLQDRVNRMEALLEEWLKSEWMVTHDWGGDRESLHERTSAALLAKVEGRE